MKTNDFTKIQLNKRRQYTHLKTTQKKCIAFDTETLNGKAFLLCASDGNVKTCHVEGLKNPDNIPYGTFKDILEYLYMYPDTLNVFFNLEYDHNALLKHLSIEELQYYKKFGYVIHGDFYLSGIPRKSIDIARVIEIEYIELKDNLYHVKRKDYDKINSRKTRPNTYYDLEGNQYILNQKVKFFDIWQFFKYEPKSSLDACSKKYLNASKLDMDALGYDKSNLPLDNTVIEYCLIDCKRTEELTNMIINACNDIGIIFNTPYSCATISSDYFFVSEKMRNPYYFLWQYGRSMSGKNKEIFKNAYNTYKGGRTEVVKRGTFEQVYEYDVNSMYPYQMTKLYDCFKCSWKHIFSDLELKMYEPENIAYAYLRCDIELYDNHINPLPVSHNGYYIYGYGKFKDYYISIDEYNLINDLELGTIEIKEGWVGLKTDSGNLVFKDIVTKLYNKRKSYDKLDFRNPLLKIILNSNYGRYIEVNVNHDFNSDIDLDDINSYDIINDDVLHKIYLAGKYFCPIYACDITAKSRCMIFENAYPVKESFIASFTDSIMSLEPLKVPTGNDLGEWEFNKGQLTIIGSGVYRLEDKLRTRGFLIKSNDNDLLGYKDNLLHDLIINGCTTTKVKKLRESLIQNKPEEFNTFVPQNKKLNLNFDQKRIWSDQFKWGIDIYRQHESRMWNINEI